MEICVNNNLVNLPRQQKAKGTQLVEDTRTGICLVVLHTHALV